MEWISSLIFFLSLGVLIYIHFLMAGKIAYYETVLMLNGIEDDVKGKTLWALLKSENNNG